MLFTLEAFRSYCFVSEFIFLKMILDKKKEGSCIFKKPPQEFNSEVHLQRKEINYVNLSQKFIFNEKDFKKQFAHIYAGRLIKMKNKVVDCCIKMWGNKVPVRKLSELADENCEKCIVVGTLFKHQELKPSVLKEISEENQIMPQPSRCNFVSDRDQLILEDEIQRIRLVGDFDAKKLVTGVVVGLLGFENEEGKFEVEEMCFAGACPDPERPFTIPDECYILMVSGLEIGSSANVMALELLVDWIKGDLGSILDQQNCSKICRVLIAGNSIMGCHKSLYTTIINTEIEDGLDTLSAVKQLDDILLDLVKTVEVDLMPGEFDPSNHVLPQQAMYDCVFPKACQYESFNSVTNPYECKYEERRILGTSGQPINDIKTLTDFTEPIDILENTFLWGHLAPSAPDTLGCYPYYKEDPFTIMEQPDVYFAGNQPSFQTKLLKQNGRATRLICIPSFSSTQTCVLVNLKTLDCFPLKFTL